MLLIESCWSYYVQHLCRALRRAMSLPVRLTLACLYGHAVSLLPWTSAACELALKIFIVLIAHKTTITLPYYCMVLTAKMSGMSEPSGSGGHWYNQQSTISPMDKKVFIFLLFRSVVAPLFMWPLPTQLFRTSPPIIVSVLRNSSCPKCGCCR